MAKVVAGIILACLLSIYGFAPYLLANLISVADVKAFERQEPIALRQTYDVGKRLERWLTYVSLYSLSLRNARAHLDLSLGLIHFQQGEVALAETYFDQAIMLAPNNAYIYIRLANALSRGKAYSYLSSYFVDIPTTVHDNELFLLELGQAHWYTQQVEQAEQVFTLLLDQHPSIQSYLQISDLYFAASLPDTALAFCKRGLQQLQEDDPALLFCAGQAEFLLNDFQAAERIFDQLVAISPQNAKFNHWLARTYARLERYDEALVYGQKAIEAEPRNVWYVAQVGNVYQLQGDYVKATDYYQQALAIDPANQVIQQYLIQLKQ